MKIDVLPFTEQEGRRVGCCIQRVKDGDDPIALQGRN
jgi:hypothetical protein